jgi:hypothetical protein
MKNPWMSLWLSAANQAAGVARGTWYAEAERQRQTFVRQAMKSWEAAFKLPTGKSEPRRRSRSG